VFDEKEVNATDLVSYNMSNFVQFSDINNAAKIRK
jgi:hypothetical protein